MLLPSAAVSPSGIIPSAHLADGRMYLVLVRNCNHLQYLRFLITLSSRGLYDYCLPYVRVLPVTAGQS
jgi:ceramide kinase